MRGSKPCRHCAGQDQAQSTRYSMHRSHGSFVSFVLSHIEIVTLHADFSLSHHAWRYVKCSLECFPHSSDNRDRKRLFKSNSRLETIIHLIFRTQVCGYKKNAFQSWVFWCIIITLNYIFAKDNIKWNRKTGSSRHWLAIMCPAYSNLHLFFMFVIVMHHCLSCMGLFCSAVSSSPSSDQLRDSEVPSTCGHLCYTAVPGWWFPAALRHMA